MIDHKLENQKVAEMYEQVTDWNITPQVSAAGIGTVVIKMKLPYKESSVIMQMTEGDLDALMQHLAQCKQAIITTKAQMAQPVQRGEPAKKAVPRRRTPQGKARKKAQARGKKNK